MALLLASRPDQGSALYAGCAESWMASMASSAAHEFVGPHRLWRNIVDVREGPTGGFVPSRVPDVALNPLGLQETEASPLARAGHEPRAGVRVEGIRLTMQRTGATASPVFAHLAVEPFTGHTQGDAPLPPAETPGKPRFWRCSSACSPA